MCSYSSGFRQGCSILTVRHGCDTRLLRRAKRVGHACWQVGVSEGFLELRRRGMVGFRQLRMLGGSLDQAWLGQVRF